MKIKTYLFSAQHVIFLAIMMLLFLSAGSLTVIWLDSAQTKNVVGEIKKLVEPNYLIIMAREQDDLQIKVPNDAKVVKNKANSRYSSLEPGDTVDIQYTVRPVGPPEADSVRASSPIASGSVIEMDIDKRYIVLEGAEVHLFYVGQQTVILRNGSLARLSDIKLGAFVTAEYRDKDDPKLDLLIIDD